MTFLRTKRSHIQTSKVHDNLCFPLRRAYLLPLLSSTYLYVRIVAIFTISFILPLSFGKRHVLGNDLDKYIHLDVGDHEFLLLTLPLS